MAHYIVRVLREGGPEYLFNARTLLWDPALAKPFSTAALARRYFRRSLFGSCRFELLELDGPEE